MYTDETGFLLHGKDEFIERHITWRIQPFASTATGTVWTGTRSREFPPDIQNTARRKLRMLNNALTMVDLRAPPNNRLEKLKSSRAGQ